MEVYEFGLAESFDEDDFNEKLTGLKPGWEKLCPGFHKKVLKYPHIYIHFVLFGEMYFFDYHFVLILWINL